MVWHGCSRLAACCAHPPAPPAPPPVQDFASGEAIQLDCLCKGEVAMRHRACAIEWSNVSATARTRAPTLVLPQKRAHAAA